MTMYVKKVSLLSNKFRVPIWPDIPPLNEDKLDS